MTTSTGGGSAAAKTNGKGSRQGTAIIRAQTTAKRRCDSAGPGLNMADEHVLRLKRLTLPSRAGVALWLAGPAGPGGVPEHLWNALSRGEKDRANRFRRPEDRALFALTRGMLRCLLSEATGVAAEEFAFAEGP